MSESTKNTLSYEEFVSYNGTMVDIFYFITGECNFHCNFCAFKNKENYQDMTLSNTQNFVSKMEQVILKYPERRFMLNFMGGEPTLNVNVLEQHFNLIKPLRDKYPNQFRIGLYTNGYFANNEESLNKVLNFKLDSILFSCSKDHFDNWNYIYLRNLLLKDYNKDTKFSFLFVNPELCKQNYIDKLLELGVSQEKINYMLENEATQSKTCLDISSQTELANFFKESTQTYNGSMYKPFGVFIINDKIYTNCVQSCNLPWCQLSDDLETAINQSLDMYMVVDQPGKEDCLLTCKYLQERGFNCFQKCKLKVNLENDKINIVNK